MPNILIIEDQSIQVLLFKREMDKARIDYVIATNLKEAEEVFLNNESESFDVIVVNGCVESNSPNSMPLIKKIVASGFDKPIIANSCIRMINMILIQAGATHLNKNTTRTVDCIKDIINGKVEKYILKDSGKVT